MKRFLAGAASLVLAVGLHAAEAPFRPPAVPLVTHSPYFSIWSETDKLTDGPTRHWTTAEQPLESLVRIDGKAYRLMGTEPGGVSAFPQVGVRVTPTSSIYDFDDRHVHVSLIFTSPLLPDDLEVLARPVTYLTWAVASMDGQPHDIQVYASASAGITIDDGRKAVTWSRETDGLLTALKAGNADQTLFDPRGDATRINWGYLYAAAPTSDAKGCIAANNALLDSFVKTGAVPANDDTPGATFNEKPGALAFSYDLGPVTSPVLRHLLLAYDETYEVQFSGQNLLPYWKRDGATASDLLQAAEKDYTDLGARCHKFDTELMADLGKAGGEKYAQICALAYRECLAANGLAADANKQPLLFTKENTSNGDIATVDVIYPQAPMLLLLSPMLAKASIAPIMVYAADARWKFPNAPHDLGTYPVATASGEASEAMPVEESANLLILCDAIVHAGGGVDFLAPWWPKVSQWAGFLEQYGLDPGDQLCTDDFMGGFAHNANLSVKAILALAAYGDLCAKRGDTAGAKKYHDLAKADADHWIKVARDGDHYRLAFDKPGWSQKYNLVWDRVLGLDIFPRDVAKTEVASYMAHLQKFGLPIDSRAENPKDPGHHAMVKSDWSTWTATLTDNQADFERIESPFYDYLNATTARNPAADLYRADSIADGAMHARPVVGGFFMKALADPLLWKKWASRDLGNPGPWAPLPRKPEYVDVFPTKENPLVWHYTRFEPASNWTSPEFDDSKWEVGPNRAWDKEKAPKPSTDPSLPPEVRGVVKEVWMRTTVKLPDPLPPNFDLMVAGHYGNEIYLNGVRVADAAYSDILQPEVLHPAALAELKPGSALVIAVHLHDPWGHSTIDIGLAGHKMTVTFSGHDERSPSGGGCASISLPMKSTFFFRRRRWVFALLLAPALTFNPVNPLLRLGAQTNAPTPAPAPASAATNAPAPSGLAAPASTEIDKETGKPVVTTQSGLKYVDLTVGTGAAIKDGDEVTAKYVGMFTDGTVFDASDKHDPPTISYIQGSRKLIPGWMEGSSTMKVGGKRKLILPPNLAYGADGNSVIPPNSTLIFVIEIVSATPAPTP